MTGHHPRADSHGRAAAIFGSFFVASGVALVVYVVSGVSLPITFGLVIVAAAGGGFVFRRRLPHSRRAELDRRVKAGVLAGCGGLVAYDGIRWLLVNVGHFRLKPFDMFSIYGQAMLGQAVVGGHHSRWWVTAVGVAFHLTNGLGFAIAYTVWLGRRGVKAGVGFAFGLQLVMLALYPGWLRIQQVGEFVQISMVGHVAYGAVLGASAKYLLRPGKGVNSYVEG